MKHFFTLLCAASIAASALADSNTGINDINVYPAPGTTVESISEIRVESGWIERRGSECVISFNGMGVNTSVTYAADQQSLTFTLDTPITKSGEYQVIIPENAFGMGWNDDNSPEVRYNLIVDNPNGGDDPQPGTIINQVPYGFTFTPEAGAKVDVLSSFSVSSDVFYLMYCGLKAGITINGKSVDYVTAINGELESEIVWTLAEPITEPGFYTIYIPAGAIIYTEDQLDAESFQVTVEVTGGEAPEPEYYPAADFSSDPASGSKVQSIKHFAVKSEKLTSLYFGPEIENITVTHDGQPLEVPFTITPDEDDFNEAHVMWIDMAKELTEPGEYVFSFPAKAFKVNHYPITLYSAPFEIKFTVESNGIDAIATDAAPAEYYDLTGRRVFTPAPGDGILIRRQGAKVEKLTF